MKKMKRVLGLVLVAVMAIAAVGCAAETRVNFEQQQLAGAEFDLTKLLSKEDAEAVIGKPFQDPVINTNGVDMVIKAQEGSAFLQLSTRKNGNSALKAYYDKDYQSADRPEDVTLTGDAEAFVSRTSGINFYAGERNFVLTYIGGSVTTDQYVQLANKIIENYTAAGLEADSAS